MRPCELGVSGVARRSTPPRFSDGPHRLSHCVTDFAGNVGCTPAQHGPDRQQPAGPPALAGARRAATAGAGPTTSTSPGRTPTRASASPIGGASWRIVGPAGYDTGVQFAAGRDIAAARSDLTVPARGRLLRSHVWLRDEAGNEAPASAVDGAAAPRRRAARRRLRRRRRRRLSRLGPAPTSPTSTPGPAGGEIHYRRLGTERWIELPTKLVPAGAARTRRSSSRRCPALGARHLRLPRRRRRRAPATRRPRPAAPTAPRWRCARPAPAAGARPAAPPGAKTRLFARLALAPPPRRPR